MNDQATLDAQAQALRAEGLTYREIGERMREKTKQVWMRCNRAHVNAQSRAWKARHREHLREYDRSYYDTHKGECADCGAEIPYGNTSGVCQECISDEADRKARKVVRLWAEGKTYPEIQAEMGWTENHLGTELHRLRRKGYELPYRYTTGKRAGSRFPEQVPS